MLWQNAGTMEEIDGRPVGSSVSLYHNFQLDTKVATGQKGLLVGVCFIVVSIGYYHLEWDLSPENVHISANNRPRVEACGEADNVDKYQNNVKNTFADIIFKIFLREERD